MTHSLSNTGVEDRDQWRQRILRALAELREGDHRVLHSTASETSDDGPESRSR